MKKNSIQIQKISALDTFEVRHPVLRPGKPIETCRFQGDELATTTHYGLFFEEKLCAVASVFEAKSALVLQPNQFQLRGMAVLDAYQGKGFGADLLQLIFKKYIVSEQTALWFNARIIAVPFYEKQGCKIISEAFEIDGIGTHFVMLFEC
jgi:GNAT superfamily N-acetyltransferase